MLTQLEHLTHQFHNGKRQTRANSWKLIRLTISQLGDGDELQEPLARQRKLVGKAVEAAAKLR